MRKDIEGKGMDKRRMEILKVKAYKTLIILVVLYGYVLERLTGLCGCAE